MYHSMTIGDRHTFRDFGLVPTSRPVVNPPCPNLSYLEIPGTNGSLDISEAVCGNVTYANRTGSFEFYVKNERNWVEVYAEVMSYLHGRRLSLILDDEPAFFYVGRISVNQWKSDKNHSFLTLDYNLEPFKYEITATKTVPWEVNAAIDTRGWRVDTLTFTSSATRMIKMEGIMPMVPILWVDSVTGTLSVTVNGKKVILAKGKNRIPEFAVKDKDLSVNFSGNATVKIYTKRGWL